MGRWSVGTMVVCAALFSLPPAPAQATFPGQPGLLVRQDRPGGGDHEILTVRPDGAALTNITNNTVDDFLPAWSADGQRIAFVRRPGPSGASDLWVMNADGSGQTQVGPAGIIGSFPSHVSWSPDGSQVAYTHWDSKTIHIINVDGTGDTTLGTGRYPEFSPDGTKIAAYRPDAPLPTGPGVVTMNPDGSGMTAVTPTQDSVPDWSPDGTRIVVRDAIVNADGTGRIPIGCGPVHSPFWSPDGYQILYGGFLMTPDGTVCNPAEEFGNDWQAVGGSGLVRPLAAAPLRVSLVPAYEECGSEDAVLTHGPPIAEPSCGPPQQSSAHLTVGTVDANGEEPRSRGEVRLGVVMGNPSTPADEADVTIKVSLTDVREQGTLADYAGELRGRALLRIADRDNSSTTSGPDPATTMDRPLEFVVPCTANGDPAGGTCELATTVDSLFPGAVKEGRRSVWGLGSIGVFDGGADGKADTAEVADGDTLFMTQGVFVP